VLKHCLSFVADDARAEHSDKSMCKRIRDSDEAIRAAHGGKCVGGSALCVMGYVIDDVSKMLVGTQEKIKLPDSRCFDLICVYWFSYRNRFKPFPVYISGLHLEFGYG
jgi:hypothetical protein